MTIYRIKECNGIQSKSFSKIAQSTPPNNNNNTVGLQTGYIKQQFNNLLKNTPLNSEIPTVESLNKKYHTDFIEKTNESGKCFMDDDGRIITVVEYKDKTGRICTNVTYSQKGGLLCQTVHFDPKGNPLYGQLKKRPNNPGDPTETYQYGYDAKGNPYLEDHYAVYE